MKALVVTTQYVNNYGAVLQAYGFHRFLKEHAWNHEFLYQLSGDTRVFESIFPLNRQALYRALCNCKKVPYSHQFKRRIRRFADFREAFLPQTALFRTQKAVMNADLAYDLYITGGDQMFNRSCLNRSVNLLEFGDRTAPRISYSTSMGSAAFSDEEKQQLFSRLQSYQELSLREETAVSFFQSGVTCPVHTNIDGSLLLSRSAWDEIAVFDEQRYPQSFILVYELLPHPDLERTVMKAKQQYGLPVVVITTRVKTIRCADYVVRDAGPREFLGLFGKAKAVITTSFHGTCFSVIYRKPFLTLIRQNEQRINAMLDSFRLSGCYATSFDDIPEPPDYTVAEQRIAAGRDEAANYLGRFFNE